jgi:hypothetical protein
MTYASVLTHLTQPLPVERFIFSIKKRVYLNTGNDLARVKRLVEPSGGIFFGCKCAIGRDPLKLTSLA